MWHSSGDEHRSCQTLLSGDTSATTYPHRDAGYAPQIQGWITQDTFITLGHHRHLIIIKIWDSVNKCLVRLLSGQRLITFRVKFPLNPTLPSKQVVIAQWLARRLATGGGVVPGSNPGKGENLLISD